MRNILKQVRAKALVCAAADGKQAGALAGRLPGVLHGSGV